MLFVVNYSELEGGGLVRIDRISSKLLVDVILMMSMISWLITCRGRCLVPWVAPES